MACDLAPAVVRGVRTVFRFQKCHETTGLPCVLVLSQNGIVTHGVEGHQNRLLRCQATRTVCRTPESQFVTNLVSMAICLVSPRATTVSVYMCVSKVALTIYTELFNFINSHQWRPRGPQLHRNISPKHSG